MPLRRESARTFVPVLVVLASLSSLAACGSSSKAVSPPSGANTPAPWPAPSDPMARARRAGLVPETAERLQYHVHSHLDVFVDGTHLQVPAGLGIDITNPAVHTFTTGGLASYGGISTPCDKPCISPLHTHDVTGILHTESATKKNNTLGQLFTEWNVRLTATCVATYCEPATAVAVYVNGKKSAGDPATIALRNREEIAVVVGTPPAEIPTTADWNQA